MERLQDEAALDRPLDRDSVARLIELGRWRGAANEGVFDGDQAAQLAEDLAEILRDTKIPADESAAAAQLLSMFLRCCDDGLFLVALPDSRRLRAELPRVRVSATQSRRRHHYGHGRPEHREAGSRRD